MLDVIATGKAKDKLKNYYYGYDLVGQGLGARALFKRLGTDIKPAWVAKDADGKNILDKKPFIFEPFRVHGINIWHNDKKLNYLYIEILD